MHNFEIHLQFLSQRANACSRLINRTVCPQNLLTGVHFVEVFVVFERFVVQPKVDADRAVGRLLVEPV
jgi:hypothetical protein